MNAFSKLILYFGLVFSSHAHAFSNKTWCVGLGYFSENSFGKITQSETGAVGQLGTITYPLLVKYDYKFGSGSVFSPTLTYTLFNRKSADNSAEVNLIHLMLPYGRNFEFAPAWDWSVGPGILNRTIKGAGGLKELNNGGSTSVFALPGRTVTERTITFNAGFSYNIDSSRFAFDLITEGVLTKKRAYNLMLSYAYYVGGF